MVDNDFSLLIKFWSGIGTNNSKSQGDGLGRYIAHFLEEQNEYDRYTQITHPRALAKQLSSDLKKIHHDRHIRVQTRTPGERRLIKDANLNFFLHTHERIKENLGFRQVKILTGNVGYLDIRSFEPLELAREKALSTLHFLKDTDAMIIDLRANIGGNPAMVQFLCSLFFDKPVHLNSIYWRRGDYTEEFWTMNDIGIAKKPDIPVFILISSGTFSAGEEMAYNLQTQKRAILIGETTAGGANPGYSFSINERFSIFIPTGRSVNPQTGTNWEGTGVKPDIQVKRSESLSVSAEKAVVTGGTAPTMTVPLLTPVSTGFPPMSPTATFERSIPVVPSTSALSLPEERLGTSACLNGLT